MLRSGDPKSAIFCIEEKSDLGRERQRKRDRYESGMAIEEMQARKRWRFGNGGGEGKIDDDEDDGEAGESPGVEKEGKHQLLPWQSSRIFRVSRGAGGKDRHSKVITAKGLRDRRVRLSVSTAIQFYDLQDRLGYDQPSKAVEWLIKAAAHAIAELPSLDVAFPTSPKQANDEKRFEPDAETEPTAYLQQQQLLSLTKSAGSSTSETSKGSVLSISRSEIRVKARERARERTAKERGKEKESNIHQQQNPNTQGSFTDLLTGCNGNTSASTIPTTATENTSSSFIHKQFRHFPSSMDYFGSAAIPGPGRSQLASTSGFSSQAHLENSSPSTLPLNITAATAGDHPELHQFSFFQDHLMPLAVAGNTANGHNLNFSISSSLAGFNRGTLQSNSSSLLPHLQRFPTPVIEPPPNLPFFIGTGASTAAADNQFLCAFDGRLQLCYGDGCKHSDFKGKGKS